MFLCFLFQDWESSTIPFQIDAQGTHICYLFWPCLKGCCISVLLPGQSCDTPLSSTGILLSFLMVGELQLDQISFDPLPSLSRYPLVEVMSREFPWMLNEWCSVSIVCNLHSVFHTAPHLKVLYSQTKIRRQAHRSTCASWMLVDSVSVNNPKFRYLQGSWPLVVSKHI